MIVFRVVYSDQTSWSAPVCYVHCGTFETAMDATNAIEENAPWAKPMYDYMRSYPKDGVIAMYGADGLAYEVHEEEVGKPIGRLIKSH